MKYLNIIIVSVLCLGIYALLGVSSKTHPGGMLNSVSAMYNDYQTLLQKALGGDRIAQYNLGNCLAGHDVSFRHGDRPKLDKATAFRWYLKSAQNGLPDAQKRVATCYHYGIYTQQDLVNAYSWYSVCEFHFHSVVKIKAELVTGFTSEQSTLATQMAALYLQKYNTHWASSKEQLL